jgi:hypothetical protein
MYLSQTAACRRSALLLPHQFAVGGDTASVLRAFVWRSSPGFLRLGVTGIHKVTSELETYRAILIADSRPVVVCPPQAFQVDHKSLICLSTVQLAVSTDWFNPSIAHQCLCRSGAIFQASVRRRAHNVHNDRFRVIPGRSLPTCTAACARWNDTPPCTVPSIRLGQLLLTNPQAAPLGLLNTHQSCGGQVLFFVVSSVTTWPLRS